MKADTKRLDHSGALDEREDTARVAKGFAYGLAISVVLWLLPVAFIVWLL